MLDCRGAELIEITASSISGKNFQLDKNSDIAAHYVLNEENGTVAGDPSGTRYNFADEPDHSKPYYYKVENAGHYGKSAMYGPIKVRKKSSGNE